MKNKVNIYLDDLRDCPDGFLLAKNIREAINIFNDYNVHILSLDHDLGIDLVTKELLPTGYDLVKYICENRLRADKIYIHTDNPVGRDNMFHTLIAAQRRGFIDSDIQILNYPLIPNKYTEK